VVRTELRLKKNAWTGAALHPSAAAAIHAMMYRRLIRERFPGVILSDPQRLEIAPPRMPVGESYAIQGGLHKPPDNAMTPTPVEVQGIERSFAWRPPS
jgi:hypothetical protein